MTDEELDALLSDLEEALQADVRAALALTADEFATAVSAATEITAAPFSVSRIKDMWNRRVGGIMTRLRSIATRGAEVAADDAGDDLPDDWTSNLDGYVKATEELLRGEVADTMVSEAQRVLADNPDATLEELKALLIATMSDTSNAMGPVKAAQIATTEATRAFNAGTLAAAQSLTGPDRPIVKQWLSRNDERVRATHAEANGQIQLLDEPFQVGTSEMQYPGDPTAPADETVNCRCVLRTQTAARTASAEGEPMADDFASNMPPALKAYWLTGEGAAKIRWGTPGAFDRCVRELRDDFPQDTEGLCANLYRDATGKWPGQQRAGAEGHTGAMIALLPSEADAARLALGHEGAEIADQLHVTLFYLGDAADWSNEQRADLAQRVEAAARYISPVRANVFGAAQWNPFSDEPAWVWNIGNQPDAEGSRLENARYEVTYALEDGHNDPELPQQHTPWVAHMCALYGPDADMVALAERVGPVTLDRVAVAFGGEWAIYDLTNTGTDGFAVEADEPQVVPSAPTMLATWSTPGDTALAFENQQTGDGRVFAPGALYWDGDGPWPLKYAHEGETLAGAIHTIGRDGDRIPGAGVLYLTQQSGYEAAILLAQGAPLGVSVDLDDVDLEMIDATGGESFTATLITASLLPLPNGGFFLKGETSRDVIASASGTSFVTEAASMAFTVGPDGMVPAAAFELHAAAGDTAGVGTVVDQQKSGDYLMKITRARVRGASLVTIPAYANARIVLDDPESLTASDGFPEYDDVAAALKTTTDYDRMLRHVRASKAPVGAARMAQALKIPVATAQRLLAQGAARGEVVKLTRGLYTDKTTSAKADHVMMDDQLTASVTGAVDLPVAGPDTVWDGDMAKARVFDWADGDASKIARAFAYRDDDADPLTQVAYKLGYADVIDGTLTIIPKGVSAALAAVNGARGGTDLPPGEVEDVRSRLEAVRAHVAEVNGGDERNNMEASAWSVMQDLPAMPAAWFAEPTVEELPPGAPGVNYSGGRIFGWVAQANEPHAGYAKKVVINDLGKIDTTHFLRQRFNLDDGSTVKAGAFTMNVGHHRDGAECETSACQFDDTRTVAGIVTVGMSDRGMWFSGAAAPWLSEWDRSVFAATQPSYHMKRGSNGQWQLRAVLAVPVPGHSSPLLASAVVERSQMALTAAATMAEVEEAVAAEEERQAAEQTASAAAAALPALDEIVAAVMAAMDAREARKAREAAELEALLAEGRTMDTATGTEGA